MPFDAIAQRPDAAWVETDDGSMPLTHTSNGLWGAESISVETLVELSGLLVSVTAPSAALRRLHLRWRLAPPVGARYLGDAWERGYGDLEWRGIVPDRSMPWYVLATGAFGTAAFGVMTQPAGFCHWRVDSTGVSLWIDLRCGGVGVKLGGRTLRVCTIRARAPRSGESALEAARAFCAELCPRPRLPAEPVYGGNDWYYAYGNSSHVESVDNAKRTADWAGEQANRPYMVIDDGWQLCRPYIYNGGPWHQGNFKFPDMARLAEEIRAAGVKPGLWFRPLLTMEKLPWSWMLPEQKVDGMSKQRLLDPSIPDVLERIASDVGTFREWGFEMIKHDFTTVDLLDRWGFQMRPSVTEDGWSFADRGRTTAEILLDLYRTLRESAGSMCIIGCNTVGHLAAGLFELQRTGDDTSGRDWERTRKMGINTLAFRLCQHGAFFAHDADCVGLTREVPWALNRQWLDLLARSGTPLFVSADPKAVGPEQERALREAFALAGACQPPAEPLDWLDTTCPARWRLGGAERVYDWYAEEGLPLDGPHAS